MKILSYSEVRAKMKSVMDDVCSDHEPTAVTSVSGNHIVLISLEDYRSLQEAMSFPSNPELVSEPTYGSTTKLS